MLSRYLPHPVLSGFVLLIWLLLVNSASPGALLVGAVLGAAVPLMTQRFRSEQIRFVRPRVLLSLVPRVLLDIVLANLAVARIILTRASTDLRPAFLSIPLELRDPHGIVALASIITLTPGTVSVQLSDDRRLLHVHMLDCPDADAAVEEIRSRYEHPLKELLEC